MIADDEDEVVNYFDVRWVDGYGHVSDAAGSLAVAIEDVCRSVATHGDAVTLATRPIRGGQAVGLVRFDTVTSSGPRTLTYVHAVALPPGYALDDDRWHRLVARRYGDDPAARIRELYEQMAVMTRDAGSDLLAPFRFDDDDVAAVLEPRPVLAKAAPTHAPDVELTAPGSPPPTKDPRPTADRSKPGRRPSVIRSDVDEMVVTAGHRPRRIMLLLALFVAAVIAVVAIVRVTRPPARGADRAEVKALREQVKTLTQERDVAVETLDERNAVVRDLTTRLTTCEARIKVTDIEAQLRAQLADVKASEAALTEKMRLLESGYAKCMKNLAP